MRSRLSLVMGCVLLVALTLGLAAPLSAASPELVINDMDAARAYFEASADGWSLSGAVSYVYADSVRYQDGSFTRPHTDLDVRLTACPDGGGDCVELYGTTDLGDKPTAAGFTELSEAWVDTELSKAWVDGVSVDLDSATVVVELKWENCGPVVPFRQVTPGVQALVGKQCDATVTGSVRITGLPSPFDFPNVYEDDDFTSVVFENYNEVFLGS